MRGEMAAFLRGGVVLSVHGGSIPQLLTELARNRIVIWDAGYTESGASFRLSMFLGDFFRLRPILKRTGCRIRVVKKEGLPFYLARLENRKSFAAGMALFVLGLYMLSTFVWQVEVEGNEKIGTQTVLAAANKVGIHPLQWKPRLKDPSLLAQALMRELPQATWIGVRIHGGRVHIQVVEADLPEERPLYSPRHLVSRADAVVTYILAEQGKALVEPNTAVKKGQILISGIIGGNERQEIVAAKGEVRGLVMYEFQIEVPLVVRLKTYTGQSYRKKYVTLWDRALQWSGFGKNRYEHYEVERERAQFRWKQYRLPLGYAVDTVREAEFAERKRTPEEARESGLQQARAELAHLAGENAVIREQKILHEQSEDGKVYMKVLFEVEQDIAKELPIASY